MEKKPNSMSVSEQFKGYWIQNQTMDYGVDDSQYYKKNPNPIFKRKFQIENIQHSSLKIACLGYYIIHINGHRIGNYELNSDLTDYSKRIYYDIYQIDKYLIKGVNTIEVELGNGLYNPSPLKLFGKYNLRERLSEVGEPRFILNIANNGKDILVTDEKWNVGQGNITMNNLYLGEYVDYHSKNRLFKPAKVVAVSTNENKSFRRSYIPKITKQKIVAPVKISSIGNDNILIDFGETISGFFKMTINSSDNKMITMKYSETMENNKLLFNTSFAGNIGDVPEINGGQGAPKEAFQEDKIQCRIGQQNFENKFCYHSFRYVLISGTSEKELSSIKATYVHTDIKKIGNIKTDNQDMNALYLAGIRTKLNNVHSIFEDCARERLGYGGDIVALANSNLYSFDLNKFYKKIIDDFVIEQTSKGGIPETAPYVGIQTKGTGQGEGPLLWQLVLPYILYKHYQFYGDRKFLQEYYPTFKKQYEYLMTIPFDELAEDCIGDHGSILVKDFYDETPDKLFLGYCTILMFIKLMMKLSLIINNQSDFEDAKFKESSLFEIITNKFKNDDDTFGKGTQTGYVFSILLNLGNKQVNLDALLNQIKKDSGIFTTGIYGMAAEYRVLHDANRDDIVSDWLNQNGPISFKNMLSNGNGVLSELFRGKHYSANHAMFSSYVQWFYEALGGIQVSDNAVGCSEIIVNPYFDTRINNFEYNFETVKGQISTKWSRHSELIDFSIKIPKNVILKFDEAFSKNVKSVVKDETDKSYSIFNYSMRASHNE